ncbi:MAG: hypothetical protein OXC28_07270 [Defluviicoccus sp.]|nr:hypothetical protein [Defluviicoccus sp.]
MSAPGVIPRGAAVVVHHHGCAAQPVLLGVVRAAARTLTGELVYEVEIPGEGRFVALASCVAPVPEGVDPAAIAGRGGTA